MRIWIDGYEANVQQRLGSGQIGFELLRNLEKVDRKNEYTVFLPSAPLGDLPKEREGWRYRVLRPNRLWTRIALPLALYTSKVKPDLFFSPTHYIPWFSPVKRVVMIFDLAYLHFPEMFNRRDLWQLTNWSKFSIQNAEHIVTISNFSKKDIVKQYGTPKNRIDVAFPGYDKELFRPIKNSRKISAIQKRYGTSKNYIIYIGTIQPRKNLVRLIEAFSKISGSDLKLVIVGKTTGLGRQGWKYEEVLIAPKKYGIEDKVIFAGFVPTSDMIYLLNGAQALIQPSLWEGFGMTASEAMACGVPVAVSNVSSLPEVVGKAGLTFDPYSVTQIEHAIRLLISDKKLHYKFSKMGLAQAKKFSWKKMAREVLKVFESL